MEGKTDMGYKVKVQEPKPALRRGQKRRGLRLSRTYGTGKEGKGEAYITKLSAEKRAKALRRIYPSKSTEILVVRTRDYDY
jgi:hypothetical protein